MTLIISAFTKNNVALASDRRLAYTSSTGRIVPGDEDACKMIHFDGKYLIAYTGPARLGSRLTRTDLWIAKTLWEANPDLGIYGAVEHLASKLKVDLSALADRRLWPISIIFGGWARFEDGDGISPCLGLVSTYIDGWLKDTPIAESGNAPIIHYSLQKIHPQQLPLIFTVGQKIKFPTMAALKRQFRNFNKHDVSQGIMLESLYDVIVQSSATNEWIGRGVLSSCISKKSAISSETGGFSLAHDHDGTGQQFRYYSANDRTHIFRGPHVVVPRCGTVTNIKVGYGIRQ